MGTWEEELMRDLPRGTSGEDRATDAQWLDPNELRKGWSYRDGDGRAAGVFLGRWDRQAIGKMDDRHVLTVAGARAGKGASLSVPNLLLYEGSVVAIDRKGELAKLTARHRRKKLRQRVVVLDPFEVSGDTEGLGWNPLDTVEMEKRDAVDAALAIAEAMIQVPDYGEKHWSEAAQVVVQALILCAKVLDAEDDRNLCTVHDLLMLTYPELKKPGSNQSPMQALFDAMHKWAAKAAEVNEYAGDVIEGVARTYREMADKERESVLSAARTQTRFLKSPGLRAVLGKSALKLADIKRQPTTLYLCLPSKHMGSHAKWLRIVISMALQSFEDDYQPAIPVLVVLDEFANLGHMAAIEKGAAFMPGYGVKLWTVLQDLAQLKGIYRDSWETFIGNAGLLTFFGNTDQFTLGYVSKLLGTRSIEVSQRGGASPGARYGGASPFNRSLRTEPLLSEPELARILAREKRRVLVKAAGAPPVIVQRAFYYDQKDPLFGGLTNAD